MEGEERKDMAAAWDEARARRGVLGRGNVPEARRHRGVPFQWDACAGSQFQNYNSISKNDFNTTLKSTSDLEQNSHCRYLQGSQRVENYKQSVKGNVARHLTRETSVGNMDNKVLKGLERALENARDNIEHLKRAEESLEHLVTKAKQEEDIVAGVIENKFAEFFASLNSRKRKLQTELIINISDYITDIHKVQLSITEKRNNLEKMARELKATHSLNICNLNQMFCSLEMTIQEEDLKLDNLKKRKLPRFYVNSVEFTSLFENMGKIYVDVPNVYSFDCPIKLCNEREEFKSNYFSRENKNEPFEEEMDASDVYFEGDDTQFQEIAPSVNPKYGAVLPQMVPTPDVIIEEIIEEDETSSIEYPEEKHQKQCPTKWPVTFGPKVGVPELVYVSCVINPSHFYVRTFSQKKAAIHLEKQLRKFCTNKCSSPTDVLELGANIFVKSKEQGKWCRAKIMKLIPLQDGKPCVSANYKICDIAAMQVYFPDFGHSEVLNFSGVAIERETPEQVTVEHTVSDLCSVVRKPESHIASQLRWIDKLALQCSLKNIVPKHSSEGWSRGARSEFLRMTNNKAVQMRVFREEDGVLIVDLMKPPANKISSDMPVSLRDALVFLDLARFRTELSEQPENIALLQYCPPVLPQENTEVPVIVSYIITPGDFYLQLVEDSPEFAVFLKKVEEVYKEEGDNLEILCPVKGQPCVAKFVEDGVWYRAQVIGLPGHQEVEVKYVDFGNTDTVNVKDMRKIKDDFLAPPAKAIRCKLAHIEPREEAKEWSSKSKTRFEELIQDKCMLCFVTEKSEDNILSIELYESVRVSPKLSCSINSLLVKEELASYITSHLNLNMATESHNEVWDQTLEELFKIESKDLKPVNVDLLHTEDLELDHKKELQVQISHVVSPSKIFAHSLSSEKLLNGLQEQMATMYDDSERETIQWKVDMACAAYIRDVSQWQRGQVCKIISENIVAVFVIDFGYIKTVNTTFLRKLEENLKAIKPLAVEYSLIDIRPTGGTDQWTATACDVLACYLTGAVVNLIIQEDNCSPLPVKIYCKGDGLYVDVSEYLVKEGLAFRKKSARKTDWSTIIPEKPHEMPLQQENGDINGVVAETEDALRPSEPKEEADLLVMDCKEQAAVIPVPQLVEAYKPPVIPGSDHFSAVVSYVADDGTIYVTPKSQEEQLSQLMTDLQSKFKCLGLLDPYTWKTGEACVVRGEDTLWYRGEVVEVGSSTNLVQYLDYGYIEKILQCHLYPTVLYANIPPLSIPCQLYKTVPVGNVWQQDAVELLRELLTKRQVEIHIMEQLDKPRGKLFVKLCFAGISLSSFMAHHKHCTNEDDETVPKLDIIDYSESNLEENCEISYEELLLSEADSLILPPYICPSLPVVGALVPVRVKHMILPNKMYLCIDQSYNPNLNNSTDFCQIGQDSDFENLDQALHWYNENIESCPFLTDFREEMPCLARYRDGFWYRAKLLFVKQFHPLLIVAQLVDYGATSLLPTSSLREIPPQLMRYPVQAFEVLLAGFKPAACDLQEVRVPYCPQWSMEAIWTLTECVQGKLLYASTVTHSPKHTVFLYEDRNLVHMKLIEMGLAESS